MKKNNDKRVYPVVITPPSEDNFFLAYVPDIDRMTQGETLAEVLEMAQDLISVHGVALQDDNQPIPEPSTVEPPHKPNEMVSWLPVDFAAYRRANETKAVHKDVTIPAYMADRARKSGLSLSAVLQEALKERVGTL
jgi:predicted RNase H-like HicB family nuclease